MTEHAQFAIWFSDQLDRKGRGAQAELARLLNLSQTQVGRMKAITGQQRAPQARELPIIARFFDVPLSEIPLGEPPAPHSDETAADDDVVRRIEWMIKRYPESRQAIEDLVQGILTRLEAKK